MSEILGLHVLPLHPVDKAREDVGAFSIPLGTFAQASYQGSVLLSPYCEELLNRARNAVEHGFVLPFQLDEGDYEDINHHDRKDLQRAEQVTREARPKRSPEHAEKDSRPRSSVPEGHE